MSLPLVAQKDDVSTELCSSLSHHPQGNAEWYHRRISQPVESQGLLLIVYCEWWHENIGLDICTCTRNVLLEVWHVPSHALITEGSSEKPSSNHELKTLEVCETSNVYPLTTPIRVHILFTELKISVCVVWRAKRSWKKCTSSAWKSAWTPRFLATHQEMANLATSNDSVFTLQTHHMCDASMHLPIWGSHTPCISNCLTRNLHQVVADHLCFAAFSHQLIMHSTSKCLPHSNAEDIAINLVLHSLSV